MPESFNQYWTNCGHQHPVDVCILLLMISYVDQPNLTGFYKEVISTELNVKGYYKEVISTELNLKGYYKEVISTEPFYQFFIYEKCFVFMYCKNAKFNVIHDLRDGVGRT